MSEKELQERLRESAKAFDGLLSLIPAQIYYGEESNDQWKRKKQSKAEKKAAKLGKLDPDSERNRTVQQVLEERARNKRKLEEVDEPVKVETEDYGNNNNNNDDDDDDDDDNSLQLDGIEMEQPLKRQKTEEEDKQQETEPEVPDKDAAPEKDSDPVSSLSAKEQKKLLKKQKKLEKKASKVEKSQASGADEETVGAPTPKKATATAQDDAPHPTTEEEDGKPCPDEEMAPIDLAGLDAKDGEEQAESSSGASRTDSPVFDSTPLEKAGSAEPASTATSIASAAPSEKAKPGKLPSSTSEAFKARLAARIEELRKARKADGAEGKPALTRQELIESRRQKQAQRKAHKKEVRRLAKEEADRKREEALASARTSPGSFMSPLRLGGSDAGSDGGASNNFAFGRIAFADGQQMSHDLSYVKDDKKKKGPSDPKTALAKLEAQKKRVARLDEDKRKEVLEKETWLAARRRAEGEKVRDDEALLRKAVKRKEQAKKKSEREWGERKAGVEKAMRERQKKREDNLRKRRDEKAAGKMGKKKGGPTKPGGGGKRNRPGFEGAGFGGGKRK